MAERVPTPSHLSREVLPPQKPTSGLGLMMVAATAMFFAVASSAFVLRARMASTACPALRAPVPAQVAPSASVTLPRVITAPDECGLAHYHRNPDGTFTVFVDACPPDDARPSETIRVNNIILTE